MATKCTHGRKKSGGCKKKPGPKRGRKTGTKSKRSKARRCKFGVSKVGTSKGRCLKHKRAKKR